MIADALYPYPDGLVIATKGVWERPGPGQWTHNASPKHLAEALEGSLKRLRLDRIDIYQHHAPDNAVSFEASVEVLALLREQGKIRHVALSNVTREHVERARQIVPIVSVRNRYSFADRESDFIVDYCEQNNIAFLPWAQPFHRGGSFRLVPPQQADLTQSHSVNPEAFDAYMQGYYFFQRNTSKDAEMAAKYYERATQLDPSYALAWVGLSRVRNSQVNIDLIPAVEDHELAREAVEQALALNPNLAEAHAQMGRIQQQADFDWAGSDASFRRAIVLERGNPELFRMAAYSAANLGRFDEALQLARRASDLDPLNAAGWEALAQTKLFMGQLDEAAADGRKALEINPDVWPGAILLSRIYMAQWHRGALRMLSLKWNSYGLTRHVRSCMRLRTTRWVEKKSRTPHWVS